LALLVARIAAGNIYPPFAADEFAVRTAGFDGCFYLHSLYLEASRDAGFAAIGIKFQKDLVPYQNFDAMEAHFAR
jgi:hypothetical protein